VSQQQNYLTKLSNKPHIRGAEKIRLAS